MTLRVGIAPGDGIGIEVMTQAERVLLEASRLYGLPVELVPIAIGGGACETYGHPLAESQLNLAKECKAVLLGAVGGPAYDLLPRHLRPEMGLLGLRKALDTFANLRPAVCFDALTNASTLKSEVVAGLDILIVRELTSGVYFGEPRGPQTYQGVKRVVDTQAYTEDEIIRILNVAGTLARRRRKILHSVEKANVMETGKFWRDIATRWQRDHFPDLTLHHMYADNCAMQLVRNPKQFDVIVTDNLFGDLLSDCAAMLTGSLGMLPSASLARIGSDGQPTAAIYEPVHGSAPDIAGKGIANPLATILCVALMFNHSTDQQKIGEAITTAVKRVLADGWRTGDIAESVTPKNRVLGTVAMGDRVVEALRHSVNV